MVTVLDNSRFCEAKNFIFSDIEREINWAKQKKNAGNFLCALALLEYTEFFGGVKRNTFKKGQGKNNFEDFFKCMGESYETLIENNNIYSVLRCGLSHEYFAKQSCTIYMLAGKNTTCGIMFQRGHYNFVVERYFDDLKMAVNEYIKTNL